MKTYLEYKDEKSHKFWQIEVKENTFTVTYGKVSTKGQSKTKEFESEEKAKIEAEKITKQKIKKGYKGVKNSKEQLVEASKPIKGNNEIDYFAELVKFDKEFNGYAQSFWIIDDEDDFFESWLYDTPEDKIKEFSKSMKVFASADATGARYVFWLKDENTNYNNAPIICYGSEGEVVIVAENIKDLIKMLSFGAEGMDGSFSHYIDYDEYDYDDDYNFYEDFKKYTPNHLTFRKWMKETLNIEPVNLDDLINNDNDESEEIEKLQKKARKKLQKSFDEWQYQFYPNLDAEEEKERLELIEKYKKKKAKLLLKVKEKPSVKLFLKLAKNEFSLDADDIDEKIQGYRISFLEKALKLDSENIEILEDLASSYNGDGDEKKQLELYLKLVKISKKPKKYYYDLAKAYENIEDYKNALKFYTKSLIENSKNAYSVQDRIIDTCNELNINPATILEDTLKTAKNTDTLRALFSYYFKHKEYNKSLENVLLYIKYTDEQAHHYIDIAEKFFKKEQYKEALVIFEETLSRQTWDDRKMRNFNYIGLCYLRLENPDIDNAFEAFKKAFNLNKKEPAIHLNINLCAVQHLQAGNLDKSLEIFDFFIENIKDIADAGINGAVYNNIGVAYKKQKQYKKALKWFEKALKIEPKNESYLKNINAIKKDKGFFTKLFGRK